jgi:hypothetical protein
MPLPLIFILPAGRSSPKSITYRDRFCHRAGAHGTTSGAAAAALPVREAWVCWRVTPPL